MKFPEENIERKAFFMEYYNLKYLIHYIDGINFNDYIIRGCNCIYYVDEEESKVINKYLDKMENVCKFPLIRYKKMLNIFMTANYNNSRNHDKNRYRECWISSYTSTACYSLTTAIADSSALGIKLEPTGSSTVCYRC